LDFVGFDWILLDLVGLDYILFDFIEFGWICPGIHALVPKIIVGAASVSSL
jgi:hypothetical protein